MPVPQQRDLEVARHALMTWLRDRLDADDVRLSDITAPAFTGFSNETLLFDVDWTATGRAHRQGMVARVKPTGYTIFLESVFEEQYRVMEALGRHTDVLVPPVVGYESDESVLGAPFFVMEKIDGRIPEDNPPYHTEGWVTDIAPADRETMWWSGIDQMARVHQVDWHALGLDFLDDTAARHARASSSSSTTTASTSNGPPRAARSRSPRPPSSGCGPTGPAPTGPPGCAGATPASAT